jgi:hypothetical protein
MVHSTPLGYQGHGFRLLYAVSHDQLELLLARNTGRCNHPALTLLAVGLSSVECLALYVIGSMPALIFPML